MCPVDDKGVLNTKDMQDKVVTEMKGKSEAFRVEFLKDKDAPVAKKPDGYRYDSSACPYTGSGIATAANTPAQHPFPLITRAWQNC